MSIARYFSPTLRRRLLRGEEPEWLIKHPRRLYIVNCTLASVEWASASDILAMRAECRRLETLTGERYVLDHVIPLTHPYVCGLNVPANLRPVPWRVNASKGNRWAPDQLELFDHVPSRVDSNRVVAQPRAGDVPRSVSAVGDDAEHTDADRGLSDDGRVRSLPAGASADHAECCHADSDHAGPAIVRQV